MEVTYTAVLTRCFLGFCELGYNEESPRLALALRNCVQGNLHRLDASASFDREGLFPHPLLLRLYMLLVAGAGVPHRPKDKKGLASMR